MSHSWDRRSVRRQEVICFMSYSAVELHSDVCSHHQGCCEQARKAVLPPKKASERAGSGRELLIAADSGWLL